MCDEHVEGGAVAGFAFRVVKGRAGGRFCFLLGWVFDETTCSLQSRWTFVHGFHMLFLLFSEDTSLHHPHSPRLNCRFPFPLSLAFITLPILADTNEPAQHLHIRPPIWLHTSGMLLIRLCPYRLPFRVGRMDDVAWLGGASS